jgi:hypothetical protein
MTSTPLPGRRSLTAVAIALAGALVLGGLTSLGQQYLPSWLNSLSNSAGGWTMLSFLLVWLGRARPVLAAVLGVVAFVALTEGYGIVSNWRGYFYSEPFAGRWTIVGLLAGPVLGVAASLTRHGSPLWRLLGVTPLSAVLLGEGVWALRTVADTTSPVYWWLEIVLSVVFLAVAFVRVRAAWWQGVIAVGVWAAGSVAFVGVIGLL